MMVFIGVISNVLGMFTEIMEEREGRKSVSRILFNFGIIMIISAIIMSLILLYKL